MLENCFTILTDLTLFVAVVSLLFYIDFVGTSIIFGIFFVVSLAYYFGTKKKFNLWGKLPINFEYLKFKFLY